MITPDAIDTYVINLARRPDRRNWIHSHLPPGLPVTYTSDWDTPFDGHDLTLTDLDAAGIKLFDWQIDSDNPWWNRPLKYGEIGCTLAHLACWTHAAHHTHAPYILILEDDAVLPPDLLDTLCSGLHRLATANTQLDLLYLGRYMLEPDHPGPIPGFVRPGYSHCTYAYLLTRSALRTLLATRLDEAIVPIDEFLPALYLPHPRPDLRTRFPPQITALAFEPPLASQRPKHEAGSDTEESDFIDLRPPRPAVNDASSPSNGR
ncbi:glycosyltransferase family 25 protein [Nocardia sp. CDC159]|uniref:Glycosyltransferase family 25 protein n=1 Tax=Nocardia pulmonis TaxID=2951408 RepID=A0A9X2E6E5_9NOCA|nr:MULTISPECIES: glycosyltransferase family 25 protein [Nocardia]MCM6774500.1 glycosyltransferase family 25 protein [Nocardia pulmonis]MCM6787434.1 glycosyltransferase family 25 protein [Nocardia sp. CDC159]